MRTNGGARGATRGPAMESSETHFCSRPPDVRGREAPPRSATGRAPAGRGARRARGARLQVAAKRLLRRLADRDQPRPSSPSRRRGAALRLEVDRARRPGSRSPRPAGRTSRRARTSPGRGSRAGSAPGSGPGARRRRRARELAAGAARASASAAARPGSSRSRPAFNRYPSKKLRTAASLRPMLDFARPRPESARREPAQVAVAQLAGLRRPGPSPTPRARAGPTRTPAWSRRQHRGGPGRARTRAGRPPSGGLSPSPPRPRSQSRFPY